MFVKNHSFQKYSSQYTSFLKMSDKILSNMEDKSLYKYCRLICEQIKVSFPKKKQSDEIK